MVASTPNRYYSINRHWLIDLYWFRFSNKTQTAMVYLNSNWIAEQQHFVSTEKISGRQIANIYLMLWILSLFENWLYISKMNQFNFGLVLVFAGLNYRSSLHSVISRLLLWIISNRFYLGLIYSNKYRILDGQLFAGGRSNGNRKQYTQHKYINVSESQSEIARLLIIRIIQTRLTS